MGIKAVGFDFFGTLVDLQGDAKTCIMMMYEHLKQCGHEISEEDFLDAYRNVMAKHRKTRHEDHREVSNCVWAVDTLKRMGILLGTSDSDIISSVEKYFSSWKLPLIPDAPEILERLNNSFEIALVSNFTYSPFIHESLEDLGISNLFHHIIVSEGFGWRKPHPNIFRHFLRLSEAKAEESIFIGDDIESDVKGAKNVGIKTVLLNRSDKSEGSLLESSISPDYIVRSLIEFEELLLSNII